MPKLQDVVRITRNHTLPVGYSDTEPAGRAWLVHQTAVRLLSSGNQPGVTSNADYITGEVALAHIVRSLWPGSEISNEESRLIYSYLQRSGNGTCVKQSKMLDTGRTTPTWRFTQQWKEPASPIILTVGRSAPTQLTRAEMRLTPEEAGETRTPNPVTITKAKPTTIPQIICDLLFAEDQPLALEEIVHWLVNAEGVKTTEAVVRATLKTMVETGQINARQETTSERRLRYGGTFRARRAQLYSSNLRPVPPRTERNVVDYLAEVHLPENPRARGEGKALVLQYFTTVPTETAFTALDVTNATGVDKQIVRKVIEDVRADPDALLHKRRTKGVNGADVYHFKRRFRLDSDDAVVPITRATPSPQKRDDAVVPNQTPADEFEALIEQIVAERMSDQTHKLIELDAENARLRKQLESVEPLLAAARRMAGGK